MANDSCRLIYSFYQYRQPSDVHGCGVATQRDIASRPPDAPRFSIDVVRTGRVRHVEQDGTHSANLDRLHRGLLAVIIQRARDAHERFRVGIAHLVVAVGALDADVA